MFMLINDERTIEIENDVLDIYFDETYNNEYETLFYNEISDDENENLKTFLKDMSREELIQIIEILMIQIECR